MLKLTQHWLLATLLLMLGAAAPTLQAQTAVQLVFQEKVTIPGPRVHLGEVADIISEDAAIIDALEKLEIALAPPPNRPRTINALSAAQRAKVARPGLAITVDGAPTIQVWVEFSVVNPEEIELVVRQHLENLLPETDGDREIDLSVPAQPVFAAAHDLQVRVIEQNIGRLRDRFLIYVGVYNDDKLVKRVTVPVSIRTFGMVVRSTRSLARNEIITGQDVELVREETTTLKKGSVQTLDDVVGKRMRRSLSADRVLYTDLLENPPDVNKGDRVMIEARVGPVLVSAKGQALEDGNVGDVIKVKNVATGVNQLGRVNGQHVVVVM
jgi:flagellar basal body P-ring formation protein FlgA